MKLRVIFHGFARRELIEAAAYYEEARPGLGELFIAAVEHTSVIASAKPEAGRLVGPEIRWWLVRGFPYAVIYRVRGDTLRILAIASTKRRPGFWLARR